MKGTDSIFSYYLENMNIFFYFKSSMMGKVRTVNYFKSLNILHKIFGPSTTRLISTANIINCNLCMKKT